MASKKDQKVLSYGDCLIRESDLDLLGTGEWLNDTLISFWISYLQNQLQNQSELNKSTISFCCFDPSMSQIIKSAHQSEDMFNLFKEILSNETYANKSIYFVPINDCDYMDTGGTHWSLLVFHRNNEESSRAEHYDSSVSNSNHQAASIIANVLNQLLCDSKLGNLINVNKMNCTKQTNAYDCGIHVLCNIEALIRMLILKDDKNLFQLTNLDVIKNKRNSIRKTILELKSTKDE